MNSAYELVVDQIYKGTRSGNSSDDPLPGLLGVSNQGGFRILGTKGNPRLIVLVTSLTDLNWPDSLDQETGVLCYYGDNKKPGRELHSTPRFGNSLLRDIFEWAHGSEFERGRVPPILVFKKTGEFRDLQFLGLAVPGGEAFSQSEDLVAIWKSTGGRRFQNYRAFLTILDAATIDMKWLHGLAGGRDDDQFAPGAWRDWIFQGKLRPLRAKRTIATRSKEEQLPQTTLHKEILKKIYNRFQENPTAFELCAAAIARSELGNVLDIDVTQPSRDGGRDAIGQYLIGHQGSGIQVEFALEAKCYALTNGVGVKMVSRLISRLRHRQFGVLVTTSYLADQAYKEIKEDAHPIIVISGADIARIVETSGRGDTLTFQRWLQQFPN